MDRVSAKRMGAAGAAAAVISAIAAYEGYSSKAYTPIKGDEVTIGYGATTYEDGSHIKPGDTITRERATALLKYHADKTAKAIGDCIGDTPVSANEFDAFVSLAYNIGPSAFCRSTLVKKLKAGDYPGACREILKWTYSGGRYIPGLAARREKEYRTCTTP